MGQPEEEEEEEDGGDEVDEDDDNVAPLFDFKKKSKRAKKEKSAAWFNLQDQNEDRRGKKRKLDSRRIGEITYLSLEFRSTVLYDNQHTFRNRLLPVFVAAVEEL